MGTKLRPKPGHITKPASQNITKPKPASQNITKPNLDFRKLYTNARSNHPISVKQGVVYIVNSV